MAEPLAYLITFTTYGTRLHGDERGSVDRDSNGYGGPALAHNPAWGDHEHRLLKNPPKKLDGPRREVALRAVEALCARRGWYLATVNIRTNHFHLLVSCTGPPEQAMGSLKAWITAALRRESLLGPAELLWTHHGSTRYLWTDDDVERAALYVRDGQGFELPGSVRPLE